MSDSVIQSAEAPPAAPANSAATRAPRVGIFDSGVGGFTVAGAIRRLRPEMDLVYFGDSLNAPYGGRSPGQLADFARNMIGFLVARQIDILAVGCNSSSVHLDSGELESHGIPAYDLVGSTIEWLRAQPGQRERVGLLATETTVRSGYYQRRLAEALPQIEVEARGAPALVPLLESPFRQPRELARAVRHYTEPLLQKGIRSIILACTHYPLLREQFLELDPELELIDPAECLAQRLHGEVQQDDEATGRGRLEIFTSLPNPSFYRFGAAMLGEPIEQHTRMFIVNPYREP